MSKPTQSTMRIGQPAWTNQELVRELEAFAALYERRPIRDNTYGMKSPHLFYSWFVARRLQPTHIVESGVYKGLGTWMFEQAAPQAELTCIDPRLSQLEYRSTRARYQTEDFSHDRWKDLPRDTTLLFFDDHQDAVQRLQLARRMGFRHAIFEDNYPASQGDCYSLKKAFMHSGFTPDPPRKAHQRLLRAIGSVLPGAGARHGRVPPNTRDAELVKQSVSIYYEFPPVFRTPTTRWSDAWTDDRYPAPPALLDRPQSAGHQVYLDEAKSYTWLCYVELAPAARPLCRTSAAAAA